MGIVMRDIATIHLTKAYWAVDSRIITNNTYLSWLKLTFIIIYSEEYTLLLFRLVLPNHSAKHTHWD